MTNLRNFISIASLIPNILYVMKSKIKLLWTTTLCLAMLFCSCSSDKDSSEEEHPCLLCGEYCFVFVNGRIIDKSQAFPELLTLSKKTPANPCKLKISAPGTLGNKLAELAYKVDALTIEGPLDKSDLQQIARYAVYKTLISLDLSQATFADNTLPSKGFMTFSYYDDPKPLEEEELGQCAMLVSVPILHITLPQTLESIGGFGLSGVLIREINFPPSLKTLKNNCLAYTRLLEGDIILHEGLKEIESYAFFFSGYNTFNTLTIPSTVKRIGNGAFAEVNAQTIKLSEGVEIVEDRAFDDNFELTSIHLPSTLKYLGKSSINIYSISKLKTIYCHATVPPATAEDYSFVGYVDEDYNFDDITVYVPVGTSEAYRQAPGWMYFNNIIESEELR